MATLDPLIQDGELTAKAAFILGHLLGAWMTFKEQHYVLIAEHPDSLFEALAAYQELIIPKKEGG